MFTAIVLVGRAWWWCCNKDSVFKNKVQVNGRAVRRMGEIMMGLL